MISNYDALSVVRDEEGNLRIIAHETNSMGGQKVRVLVLNPNDAAHVRNELARKLAQQGY